MKLKILFFPFVLVACVVATIWYIWPMYQTVMETRDTLALRQSQHSALQARAESVDTIARELSRNTVAKNFLFRYIPKVADEEYVIDAIDNAAKVAGINLIVVDLQATRRGEEFFGAYNKRVSQTKSAADTLTDQTQEDTGAVNVAEIVHPEIKEFIADAVVVGPYDGIRKFLANIHVIDRLHGVVATSVERVSEDDIRQNPALQGVPVDEALLLTQVLVSFAYMGDAEVPYAASGDLFKNSIDLGSIDTLYSNRTAAPVLDLGTPGRSNPFMEGDGLVVPAPEQVEVAAPTI